MKNRKKVEVLAPAGSFDSMKAAVNAGADAVYIGGTRFGARAYADNLDQDRMIEAIDYAHLHGISLYMTVNTLVKEREFEELYEYLRPYYERGLDAVIVQDFGVLRAVRRWFPDLHVHASTQMTVTGVWGAKILKEMGAARVVTARELSLRELRSIHEQVDIEIESFVHGALCYSYSGQCLMSSLIGGRSGNRGRCAQPCRLPYDVMEGNRRLNLGDRQYVMSLKDLCTLDILPDILESGVYSLKIEGRMKSPRYTAGVVRAYRKYVDRYLSEGREGYRVSDEDRKQLLDLFDRGGQTDGYYGRHNGGDMVVMKEKPAFRQANQQLFDYLDKTYVEAEKKEKIDGCLTVSEGEPARLSLWCGEATAEVWGEQVQTARNQPMTPEKLKKQIQKTGGTPFEFEHLKVETKGMVFLPVQALNELRRSGLEQLKQTLLQPFYRQAAAVETEEAKPAERPADMAEKDRPDIHVLLSHPSQWKQVLGESDVREIQIEADGFEPGSWRQAVIQSHDAGKTCVLAMPVIFRTEAETFFKKYASELKQAGFDGILVRNLEEIGFLREFCGETRTPLYGDCHLYMFNREAAHFLAERGISRMAYPLELNGKELQELSASSRACFSETELVAYGYLPAMVTAQCIRRTVEKCLMEEARGGAKVTSSKEENIRREENGRREDSGRPQPLTLRDRTGREFPVRNHCRFCYNMIYNPQPLSLLGMEDAVRRIRPGALRLQFLDEEPKQVSLVIKAYGDAFLRGIPTEHPAAGFTRGHMKRGVE